MTFLRKGLKATLRVFLVLFTVWFIYFAVAPFVSVPALPGLNGAGELPEVPAVDQVMLDRATQSRAGQELRSQGFEAKNKVENTNLVAFLDEQQKKLGVANPGPYVRFSTGQPQVARADSGTAPDMIVDATHGVIVAVSQEFSNDRGAACYNGGNLGQLTSNWVLITQYMHGKLMPAHIPVTRGVEPSLPEGLDAACYAYPS